MKSVAAVIGAAAILMTVPSFAQSTAPRTTDRPPAVADPDNANKTTAAPVAGKNSFTEKQVVERLQEHGYSNVAALRKDEQSVWHGTAVMSGKTVNVAVDYQGNITTH